MIVKTHRDGCDNTGLHIGRVNARRYFRRLSHSIDLKLDDLQIQCTLSPDFWDARPEIHDPRLSEWLEFKVGRRRAGLEPMQLTMVPAGDDTFVIKPKHEQTPEAFGAEISLPRKVAPQSVLSLSPVQVFEAPSVA